MATDTESIKILAQTLEKQELDSLTGVVSPEIYAQLLAIYLFQNNLCNAKNLWKRIPQSAKTSHAELGLIWKVGQNIWRRDFAGVYTAMAVEWSENVSHIMAALLVNFRKRALHLVSSAYSSISLNDLATIAGLTVEETIAQATAQGWQVDELSKIVNPCKPPPEPHHITPSEDQLNKLTEFVSFLEN